MLEHPKAFGDDWFGMPIYLVVERLLGREFVVVSYDVVCIEKRKPNVDTTSILVMGNGERERELSFTNMPLIHPR